MNVTIIPRAAYFASMKHRDQRREDHASSPYINHPIAVALLHETIENTDTSSEEREAVFGALVREGQQRHEEGVGQPKLSGGGWLYMPIAAYLGNEDWCLGLELRPAAASASRWRRNTFWNGCLRRVRELVAATSSVPVSTAASHGERTRGLVVPGRRR